MPPSPSGFDQPGGSTSTALGSEKPEPGTKPESGTGGAAESVAPSSLASDEASLALPASAPPSETWVKSPAL